MKTLKLLLGIALAAAIWTASVWAETVTSSDSQPAAASQAASEDDRYVRLVGEGEATLLSAVSLAQTDAVELCCDASECDCSSNSFCTCDDAGSDCLIGKWLAGEPFKLPQPGFLQSLGISAGGWIQAGITVNGKATHDKSNGPVLTNDRHGELQMNELWFYLHRPVDTSDRDFDIGGRVDFLYGTDWRAAYFHGFGAEDEGLNGSNQLYGLSIPQFYGEVALKDLSVKVGRMTGILGYEMIPPMGNFFYSHSYALCYGEPILITGAMANYKVSDQTTVLAGLHQGVHRFEDNNDSMNFQGGLMWNSPDQRFSLAYALDVGKNDFLTPVFHLEDEYLHSLVFKFQATEKLLYVLQNDLGYATGAAGFSDAQWYGINQYLLLALDEHWSAGLRVEWFRDDDGTRVLGLGNLDARGWEGLPGFSGNFSELSVGLNWKPKANILLRPELRWDWYSGSRNLGGELPFGDGNSSSQFTFATDLVVMF